jgi:hypothetical protein
LPTTIVTEGSIILDGRVCAYLGALLQRAADELRRDHIDVPANVDEAVAKIGLVGDAWVNAHRPDVSPEKARVDATSFEGVLWTSAVVASDRLDISPQAVTGLLRRGTLHGEQDGQVWKVCAEDVTARTKGSTCSHR